MPRQRPMTRRPRRRPPARISRGTTTCGPPSPRAAPPNGAARPDVTFEDVSDTDRELLTRELGRPPRGLLAVAYRCDHGVPAVVQTSPRLPDGTPFPTMFYLCCSALNAAVSRMESAGLMREMTAALAADPELAAGYRAAHEQYLRVRNQLDDLGIEASAGGMPD